MEASHGCVHRCRHCPVPTVYDGRIRVVEAETVLRDIERLADIGARHITFGDPDFLNGWRHSLAIVRALHERCPELTSQKPGAPTSVRWESVMTVPV